MANPLVEFVKQVVALTRDVQQGKENIKELREDLKLANQKIDRLMEAFQRLTYEFQRERDNAERDREIQRLQLENTLLRARQLPSSEPTQDEAKDAQIASLRRENEELCK